MVSIYCETLSLCPTCAMELPARYEEYSDRVELCVECPEHGVSREPVECDAGAFRKYYEMEYATPPRHLVLPVTYRCNMNCRYCYSLSNAGLSLPPDRDLETLLGYIGQYGGNVTLIGGEPTVRNDLHELVAEAKRRFPGARISVATNGQKLVDLEYVRRLKDTGLDFVFLSLNDVEYEPSEAAHRRKLQALENCRLLSMPVWLQRTVDSISQVHSLVPLVEHYRRIIFDITLRAVKPFGSCYPSDNVYVSQIVEALGLADCCAPGTTPFNRLAKIAGRPIKICSWVHDTRRLDPIDSGYVISSDVLTTFHRGMKVDEVLLRRRSELVRAQ